MALSKLTKVQTLGIGSNIEVVGVITTGQFKSGTSNLHSSGVELTNLNVSGIATIGGTLSVTGNVSIGGTLTYEDVTNIDSVGVVTARAGVVVSGGTLTIPTVAGTNTNTSLNVLFQTAAGVIDGGSALTYNPAQDVLSVNGNHISAQTFRGDGALGTLTCDNHSSTTAVAVSNTVDITTVDNATGAFTVKQGSNEYITIDTTNSSELIKFGTAGSERLRITSGGRVGIGTNNPLTRLHVADTNTTVWPFASAISTLYAYTPYPHELVIDNDVKGTEGSFAGIYFNAGSDTDGSKVSTARIAAVDTGNYKADLVFSNRGSGGSSHKENLRITSVGNVNINSSGLSSPYSSFRHISINNNLILNAANSAGGFAGMQHNAYLNSSGNWVRINNDHATSIGTDDGNFYIRNVGAGTGNISWNMPVKIQANNRINIGEGNSGSPLGAVHINTSSAMGTDTALWIGSNSDNRYMAINQNSNTEQFSHMELVYNDNGSRTMLQLKNPYAPAGYGSAIGWKGYNNGDQGYIECKSEGANNAAATMYLNTTNGTFLQGNSSRHVTMPQQPAFLAYHYAHDINYNVGNTLPYPYTVFNTGNHYNTSNSTFTAPTAGRYLFSINANGNYTSGASGIPRAYWKINGSNVGNGIHLRGSDATHDGLEQRSQTVIFNLSVNDTVNVVVGQNQWDLFGANSFMGYLIG